MENHELEIEKIISEHEIYESQGEVDKAALKKSILSLIQKRELELQDKWHKAGYEDAMAKNKERDERLKKLITEEFKISNIWTFHKGKSILLADKIFAEGELK